MPATATQNRLDQLFQQKQERILNVYFTAGYPQQGSTVPVLKALQKAGADIVEIGIPYSDPVADGPTIQASNQHALEGGMTMKRLFEQLKEIRNEVSLPLVLMGYFNPVLQYGVERFCQACAEVGIDGLILPDLPMYEYREVYQPIFQQYGLHNIFLISPQTSPERVREIDEHSSGFIYMVSSASITGARRDITDEQIRYFERINSMQLQRPRLIGFGISNRQTFEQACQHAQGAIIGSAFINLLGQSQDLEQDIIEFVSAIKGSDR
ncbi:tryptophan synthase subunit alpha [Cesiribacter andamanensis]|uniref:Tryptophan synthase alpha chain n=1 Tax=Cesiribacter andamanensis AMV16 TaxID=1279009 RepID=M7N0L3_9BACT|nr:tryptophan synthase subunit alpha [Cesiribacter andamanensis]EMR00751.1 Tryptophan synthase alpha chain [Cesiribacter andamanensis AMV16]